MEVNDVDDKYLQTYSCELCKSKTYPTLEFREAEKHDASIGAFIIRRNVRDGKETRRSVLCYQCMRKTEPEDVCNKDEKPFMCYLAPEGLYDESR